MDIRNGNCLDELKSIPDKSIDLFICDLPYGETNCKWDSIIDLKEFWNEFKRVRKSKKTPCIHFCSTKFGYSLIKSNEKMFKMDMVWKKRNKTGGLQSRQRPMRNHEMVYFFYEQAPKYNRDKYHKRIEAKQQMKKSKDAIFGGVCVNDDDTIVNNMAIPNNFDPKLLASVVEEKDEFGWDKSVVKETGTKFKGANYEPPNPASVLEEQIYNKNTVGFGTSENNKTYLKQNPGFEPRQPASVLEEDYIIPAEDEPLSMYESKKVFIGKRHHQTEKPIDILEFFLKYWTDEDDVVLDPTMGSGSTGVACKNLNRKFIGFELDEKIFKVAEKRLKE